MTLSVLLLIISALFHALWNFALKCSQHKLGAALAFMLVATALNAVYGLTTAPLPQLSISFLLGTVAAGVFEGLYFHYLNTAYTKQGLGVAYTIMRGGAMVLVWVISTLALGEIITTKELFSVFVILIGIALVQRTFTLSQLISSGTYAAYLCAGCIAGYHIGYGIAVQTGAAPALVFAASMACGVVTYVACSRGQALQTLSVAIRQEPKLVMLGGATCGLSFLLFLTALVSVDPGKAISLRNTSVAFGAMLSLVAGERLHSVQWLGVACVVGGVLGLC